MNVLGKKVSGGARFCCYYVQNVGQIIVLTVAAGAIVASVRTQRPRAGRRGFSPRQRPFSVLTAAASPAALPWTTRRLAQLSATGSTGYSAVGPGTTVR